MKYCVIGNLRFETPAKRDGFFNSIKIQIDGKTTWGELVNQSSTDEEGYPSHNLVIRFDNEADMDNLYALIKGRMEHIPVLKGTVSKHPCPHDEGGGTCVISEKYEKE